MRQGWGLLKPDLALWAALSTLVAVAAMALPAPGGDTPPPALPFFVSVAAGLVVTMLPAVLFTAQLEGRRLTWGPVLLLMARRAGPLVAWAVSAIAMAWGAESVMLVGVSLALGDSPALIPVSTVGGLVILVSILVRYSFLVFVVMLLERREVPASLWQWQRAAALAPVFWPLTVSARLTEGRRWPLAFYTALGQALPALAALVPAPWSLPCSVLAMMVLTTVQAVLFAHYRARCDDMGLPAPRLPLEEALAA